MCDPWDVPEEYLDDGDCSEREVNASHDASAVAVVEQPGLQLVGPLAEAEAATSGPPGVHISQDVVLQRRKRGRPVGTYGRPEHRRRLREIREQEELEVVAQMKNKEPAHLAAARQKRQLMLVDQTLTSPLAATPSSIAVLLRPEQADPLLRDIVTLVQRPITSKDVASSDKTMPALVENCMGPLPRNSMTIEAEAKLLGISRSALPEKVEELASMTYCCGRLLLEGVASHFRAQIEQGKLEPLCECSLQIFDETPMPLRVNEHSAQGSKATSSDAIVPYSGLRQHRRALRTTTTTKLLQVERAEAFVVRDVVSKKFLCVVLPQAVPVLPMAQCVGETLWTAIEHRLSWSPVWLQFCELFKFQAGLSVCDGASSNGRYEAAVLQSMLSRRKSDRAAGKTKARLRLFCEVHMLSTIVGRSYAALTSEISGLISLCLASRASGAIAMLRHALTDIIQSSVVVHKCSPPLECHPRLAAVLDVCLPHTSAGEVRKHTLRRLLTGNISLDVIDLCTLAQDPAICSYAESLSEALLPGTIGMFARHRWLTTLGPLKTVTLIDNVHHLLRRAGPLWIAYMRGKPRMPARFAQDDLIPSVSWNPPNDDDDDKPSGKSKKAKTKQRSNKKTGSGGAPDEPQTVDWAAINEQRRGDSLCFVRSNPGEKLLVATICLMPCVDLMHTLEQFGSRSWDAKQRASCCDVDGRRFVTRMEHCVQGKLTEKFFASMSQLMEGTCSSWTAVHENDYTMSHTGLAFSMLSTALCGVKSRIEEMHKRFPFLLWGLLGDEKAKYAERCRRTEKCLLDEFSIAFLQMWASKLDSAECRAVLHCMGCLLRTDIMKIECRNAVLRRLVKKERSTWKRAVEAVSADFLLMTQRILEEANRSAMAGGESDTNLAQEKQQRRSLGPHDAFMHDYLAEAAVGKTSKDDRKAYMAEGWKQYRECKQSGGDEYARLAARGVVGTAAASVGGSAFGSQPSKASKEHRSIVDAAAKAVRDLVGSPPAGTAHPAGDESSLAVISCTDADRSSSLAEWTAELQGIRRNVRLQSQAEAAEVTAQSAAVVSWSRRNASTLDMLPGVKLGDGATPMPDGGDDMDYVHWVCPAASICQRLGCQDLGSLRRSLREEWDTLHEPLTKTHSFTSVKYPKITRCMRAGFCVCRSVGGRLLDSFVGEFQDAMHGILSGGDPAARTFYDMNALVIRLKVQSTRGVTSHNFFHIGMGNLSSRTFEMVKLDEVLSGLHYRVAAGAGLVALSCDTSLPACGAGNMWATFAALDLTKSVWLRLYRIAARDLRMPSFRPRDIFAEPLKESADAKIWDGRSTRQPRPPPAPSDSDSDGDADPDEHAEAETSSPPPLADESEPEFEDDDGSVELPDMLVRALESLIDEGMDGWSEPPSDSGSGDDGTRTPVCTSPPRVPEVVPPGSEIDHPAARGLVVPALEPVVAPLPPLTPLPPPPIPGGPALGAGGRAAGRKGRGGRGWRAARGGGRVPYQHYDYGHGYFIIRPDAPTGPSIDAHCSQCECKLDRKSRPHPHHDRSFTWKAQGRPLGMQLLWLAFDCGGDRDRHKEELKKWAEVTGYRYEDRCTAREAAMTLPSLAEVFDMERDPWPDEARGEPHYLCGIPS